MGTPYDFLCTLRTEAADTPKTTMYINGANTNRPLIPKRPKRRKGGPEEISFAEEIEALLKDDAVELARHRPQQEQKQRGFGKQSGQEDAQHEEDEAESLGKDFKVSLRELDVTV